MLLFVVAVVLVIVLSLLDHWTAVKCQRWQQGNIIAINLSTARPKWRLDGPALSGHLLYSLVHHAYANRYHHHLVSDIIIMEDLAFIL